MGFGPKLDFSGVSGAVEKQFLEARKAKVLKAAHEGVANQRELNRIAARDHRSMEGLGAPTMYVDQVVAHQWANQEGSMDVIHDKTWQRMQSDNIRRVKATGTRVQVMGVNMKNGKIIY